MSGFHCCSHCVRDADGHCLVLVYADLTAHQTECVSCSSGRGGSRKKP